MKALPALLLVSTIMGAPITATAQTSGGSALPPDPNVHIAPNLTKPRRPFADRDKLVGLASECSALANTISQPIQRSRAVRDCAMRVQAFLDDNRRVQWTGTLVQIAPLTTRGVAVEIQIAPTVFLGGLSEGGILLNAIDEPSPLFDKLSKLDGGETVKFKATLWQVLNRDISYPQKTFISADVEDIEVLPAAQ